MDLRRYSFQFHSPKVQVAIQSRIRGAMELRSVLLSLEDALGITKQDFLAMIAGWLADQLKVSAMAQGMWLPDTYEVPPVPVDAWFEILESSNQQNSVQGRYAQALEEASKILSQLLEVLARFKQSERMTHDMVEVLFGEPESGEKAGLAHIVSGARNAIDHCRLVLGTSAASSPTMQVNGHFIRRASQALQGFSADYRIWTAAAMSLNGLYLFKRSGQALAQLERFHDQYHNN